MLVYQRVQQKVTTWHWQWEIREINGTNSFIAWMDDMLQQNSTSKTPIDMSLTSVDQFENISNTQL